jgi:hypothetical protein
MRWLCAVLHAGEATDAGHRREKSPILAVPGSVTYGCVMVGILMLAAWPCVALVHLAELFHWIDTRPQAQLGGGNR